MIRAPERDESAPAEGAEGTPGRDARPALDTHFLLLEVGKLLHSSERLVKDIEKIDKKLDSMDDDISELKHSSSFLKGAMWVIGGLVVLSGILIAAYVNGKLAITVRPGP
jgi:hypothetical protein